MKNELTAVEWIVLAEAVDYLHEVAFFEQHGDMVPDLENAIEKVKDTANNIKERNK